MRELAGLLFDTGPRIAEHLRTNSLVRIGSLKNVKGEGSLLPDCSWPPVHGGWLRKRERCVSQPRWQNLFREEYAEGLALALPPATPPPSPEAEPVPSR